MKKVFLMMTAFCVMLSFLTGCGNGNAPKGYKTTNSGLYYRFYVQNDGDLPQVGDLVEVTLSCVVNDTATIIPASSNIIHLRAADVPVVGDCRRVHAVLLRQLRQPRRSARPVQHAVMRVQMQMYEIRRHRFVPALTV